MTDSTTLAPGRPRLAAPDRHPTRATRFARATCAHRPVPLALFRSCVRRPASAMHGHPGTTAAESIIEGLSLLARARLAASSLEILFPCAMADRGTARLQHEDLGGDVGIRVDLAQVGDDLAPGDVLDDADERLLHRALKALADVVNGARAAGGDQRLLDHGEPAVEEADERVVDHERLGLRRSLAVVLLVQADERGRDPREHLAAGPRAFRSGHDRRFLHVALY